MIIYNRVWDLFYIDLFLLDESKWRLSWDLKDKEFVSKSVKERVF